MVNMFILLLVTLVARATPAEEACTMPASSDPATLSDCSQFHWGPDDVGGLTVQSHGEALWVDARGVLHVGKTSADVPEPYRSMYRALHKQSDGSYKVIDDVPAMALHTPEANAASPLATEEANRRQAFRSEITGWRQELYESTRMLLEAVLHAPGDGYNPLAFAYVPGRIAYGEEQNEAANAAAMRVLRARAALLEGLPARARAEGIPPAWLQ